MSYTCMNISLMLIYATLHNKGNLNLLGVYRGSITICANLRMFAETAHEA